MQSLFRLLIPASLLAVSAMLPSCRTAEAQMNPAVSAHSHMSMGEDAMGTFVSKPFAGVKANKGSLTARVDGRRIQLSLSDDFVVPDTPAPHWQVVDSRGNAYLLQRLVPKGGMLHKTITVPEYVPNVAKVQIWCAFAEVNLGETTFDRVLGQDDHVTHRSTPFTGVKANKGAVSHSFEGGRHVLTLTDEFVVPDTPAPHWQVVDSRGRVYLLNRLTIKGGVYHKKLVLPSYVSDVAKVQIWCAFAETVLGEASFDHIVQ